MVPTVYTDTRGRKISTNQVCSALLYFRLLFMQHANFIYYSLILRFSIPPFCTLLYIVSVVLVAAMSMFKLRWGFGIASRLD